MSGTKGIVFQGMKEGWNNLNAPSGGVSNLS